MLDAKLYPEVIDAVWLFMSEDAAIVAGNVCRNWRDRATEVLIGHISLHLHEDTIREDEVPQETYEGMDPSYRNIDGRVLIKSYQVGSKKTLLLRSLPYRRQEIFDWDRDDWKYEKEWVEEELGEKWTRLLARTRVVDVINWGVNECRLGELTECLFWATNQVRYNDDSWPDYGPFRELYDGVDDDDDLSEEPVPPLVRWHNVGPRMPHWDLGPQHLLLFLRYSHSKITPEVESVHEKYTMGREPQSCQNLTLSIDCYGDPIQQTYGSWPALGQDFHEWGQEVFTVLLFNKTKRRRWMSFSDVGNGRGLLVNFLETFPSVTFSDIIIVGLEEFIDDKPSLETYKRFLTQKFKKKAKASGLRLHPSQFGARILFRTHRGHKIIMNRGYGKSGYATHALK